MQARAIEPLGIEGLRQDWMRTDVDIQTHTQTRTTLCATAQISSFHRQYFEDNVAVLESRAYRFRGFVAHGRRLGVTKPNTFQTEPSNQLYRFITRIILRCLNI